MNKEIDYSLLPPCCNTGCTVCVLDYPELYLDAIDPNLLAMLEAMEKSEKEVAEKEETEWTNSEKMN